MDTVSPCRQPGAAEMFWACTHCQDCNKQHVQPPDAQVTGPMSGHHSHAMYQSIAGDVMDCSGGSMVSRSALMLICLCQLLLLPVQLLQFAMKDSTHKDPVDGLKGSYHTNHLLCTYDQQQQGTSHGVTLLGWQPLSRLCCTSSSQSRFQVSPALTVSL